MSKISDLKARIKKGQSLKYIASVYGIKVKQVANILSSEVWISPSVHNLDIRSNLPHGKHYDITEEEIINGYIAPKEWNLKGEELAIYKSKIK